MKKRLGVLSAIVVCLLAVAPAKAADPGSRYADAFVLIEQGQTAEEKGDFAAASQKYQESLGILHGIQSDSPDWNKQMVDYRAKDCQARVENVKGKVPAAPAEVASTSVVTPAVQVPPPAPAPAPVVITPTPAPASVVKAAPAPDQSAKYKAQLDKLEAENHQLKSNLSDAQRSAKSAGELDKENKDLKAQLTDTQKKLTVAQNKPVPAPIPVSDGPEVKKLRGQLADANSQIDQLKKTAAAKPAQNFASGDSSDVQKLRAQLTKSQSEADAAKKTAAQVPDLQKQNKDLSAQLVAAQKKTVTPVTDTTELKKSHADLEAARTDADKAHKSVADLQKQNSDLNTQLADAKKQASAKAATPVDSTELKKTRADLEVARNDAATQAKKSSTQIADLQKQNGDLNAKLVAADKKSSTQVADLQKQNSDLNTKLAAAEKKSNVVAADSGEVKNLHAELDKSNAQVADLKKQLAAKPVPGSVAAGDSAEVKNLRTQLASTQKELDDAKKSGSKVSDLEKQNQDLSAKLTASDKKASVQIADLEKQNKNLNNQFLSEKKAEAEAPNAPPDARVMKQLRNENSYLRNLLDTYSDQNAELKGQLHHHDQNAAKSGL